jgi:DNA-damage-inducible protein D
LREQDRILSITAHSAGVTDYANFPDYGYLDLYDGRRTSAIRQLKGIGPNDNPMDFSGSEELADNIFRAAQTAAKKKRVRITSQEDAEQVHLVVGRKVRKTIDELGGTMPENLHTPPESVQKLERRKRCELK